MRLLTQDFLDQCPVEHGFRLRGMDMTRIEVFVDGAFAFAVTMLVISFDSIPQSYLEMVEALKGIPAFVVAVAQLVWIWHEHNVWSRRFGLDDAMTVFLSTVLLIIVLVYIYPLRVMAQGMFEWFTGGYLPSSFDMSSWEQLRFMFVFMGIGFSAVCLTFVFFYRYASRRSDQLRLSGSERYQTRTVELLWAGCAVIGLLSVALAMTLPDWLVPFSGFAYAGLGLWIPFIDIRRGRYQAAHFPSHQ